MGPICPVFISPESSDVRAAARALAATVQPLDSAGTPDTATGKIVMISIGMSNTTQEFGGNGSSAFKPQADAYPAKNPRLTLVDGAQGGQDASDWLAPNGSPWTTLSSRLSSSGVSPAQVQVAWMKEALRNPAGAGAFPSPRADAGGRSGDHRAHPADEISQPEAALSLQPHPCLHERRLDLEPGTVRIRGSVLEQMADRRPDRRAEQLELGSRAWAGGRTAHRLGSVSLDRRDEPALGWFHLVLQRFCKTIIPIHLRTAACRKWRRSSSLFSKTDATATPWFLSGNVTGQPPVLSARANQTSGNAPLALQFHSSASDPDGAITGYQWTFSDGTFSNVQNPAKTFTSPGRYEARVSVTDHSGNTARQTVPITVDLLLPQWREIYFTATELGDPQISGDLADPDRDGVANLAEYALRTNLKTADAPVFTARTEAGRLTITFPRAGFANDAVISLEVANELSSPWSSGGTLTSESVLADDGIVQTMLATDLAQPGSNRFTRLRDTGPGNQAVVRQALPRMPMPEG